LSRLSCCGEVQGEGGFVICNDAEDYQKGRVSLLRVKTIGEFSLSICYLTADTTRLMDAALTNDLPQRSGLEMCCPC